MFCRSLLLMLVLSLVSFAALLSQQKPEATSSAPQEYPLILEKGVTAGKTAVGTRVQGKLSMATLVNGKVVPRNAVFSGEVVQSNAKTATEPSRLSIRMESVTWKQGSEPVQVYLTSWYYPTISESGQPLQYGPEQPASRTWDGQGQYPDANSKVYRPFPGTDSGNRTSVPSTSNQVPSNHRVPMKDIDNERLGDGGMLLVSKRSNIKLDNFTTYVFATRGLVPSK